MKKPLVLVVDDEHANQFLLDGLLQANGYNVAITKSGTECIEYLKLQTPDLILMDIMMPKMTGVEALRSIKQNEELSTIPVLMVSAKTDTSDIKEALDLGALDYIKKPFNEIELLARIKVGLRIKANEDNLREMIKQRDDFVKIVSHDLRSPFTAIHGFSELLQKATNLTPDQKETLGYIIESVEYSNEYFNKLLGWTMLESKDIELNIEPTKISELIDSVFRVFEHKAGEKNVKLINKVDAETIDMDKTFFRQLIANLVSNSIKFSNNSSEIICSLEINEERFTFKIQDQGIGMPPEITAESLFSGYSAKTTRGTRGEKGTGIGLHICKKISDAHGYDIGFKRAPTAGTEFFISGPIRHSAK